jgi:hypothetical protein
VKGAERDIGQREGSGGEGGRSGVGRDGKSGVTVVLLGARPKQRAEERRSKSSWGKKASLSSMGRGSLAGHGWLFVAMLKAVQWGKNLSNRKIFASNGGKVQRSTGWQGDLCIGSQRRGEGEAVGHSLT